MEAVLKHSGKLWSFQAEVREVGLPHQLKPISEYGFPHGHLNVDHYIHLDINSEILCILSRLH